jgi:hypothetical protein
MDKPYSKREIDQLFQAVKKEDDDFKFNISASLTRIESQTVMTNGRVTKLERWQSYVIGFCACLSLLVFSFIIPLIPVLSAYLQSR